MNDEENLWLQKRMAYLGIYTAAGMAIGAALFSVGLAIMFSLGPYLAENEQKGFTTFQEQMFYNQLYTSDYFVIVGLIIIAITAIGTWNGIRNVKLNQCTSTTSPANVQSENVSNNNDSKFEK